jgi:stage II sporulation protein AA (anti-sigma F factor antagonist)
MNPVPVGGYPPQAATWQVARPVPPRELAHVTLHDRAGVTVAMISGEIDMASVDHVAAALTDLSNLAMGLVVDLRSVGYLDSSGISLLHDLAVRLRQGSQMLIIVCPPGSPPRRVLELTGLDAQAIVLDELEPAVEAIRAKYASEPPAGGGV